jgi:hypothetical protein
MAITTSHQIARKLLSLPDLPLVNEYAEDIIADVKESDYEDDSGKHKCIIFEVDDFDTQEVDPVMEPGE